MTTSEMRVVAGDCDGCPTNSVFVAQIQDNERGGHARLCLRCLIDTALAVAEARGDKLRIRHTYAKTKGHASHEHG